MTDENVRHMWSDDELDHALATLNADVPPGDQALARIRAELLTTAGRPAAPKRHWGRWVAASVIVAAMIATALVVPTLGRNPSAGAAAAALNAAADRISVSDPVVLPGQYRYIAAHGWAMRSAVDGAREIAYLAEVEVETWVPADRTQEWLRRTHYTGNRKWVLGTEADYPRMKLDEDEHVVEQKERCGYFEQNPGEKACEQPGGWMNPTPEFFASLPADPRQLYDRIRRDTAGMGPSPDVEALDFISRAIGSGFAPAGVRANLYRAAALVPGLEISDQHANLDGRIGIALGVERDGEVEEMIVDPQTGEHIGYRRALTEAKFGYPAGTVIAYTSSSTGVAQKMGDKPAN